MSEPYGSAALAIEDSVRLFKKKSGRKVPYVPGSRKEKYKGINIFNATHEEGSHLLTYSQHFDTHKLKEILRKDSEYVWLVDGGHESCLLDTYKWLYKLHVIKKACSEGLESSTSVNKRTLSQDSPSSSSDDEVDSFEGALNKLGFLK